MGWHLSSHRQHDTPSARRNGRFQKNFTILDNEDAKDLIEVVLKDSKIDRKERRFPKGGILKEIFSYAINTMEEIETSVRERAPFFYDIIDEIALVSRLYTEKKRVINAVDFDDLLFIGISSFWSMRN